jgi:hypothetical protein
MQSTRRVLEIFDTELSGHKRHCAVPMMSLYVLAGHAVQGPPLGPVKPGMQEQLSMCQLPGVEVELGGQETHTDSMSDPEDPLYFPLLQSVHAFVPGNVLYVPGSQAVHESYRPVNPALQRQSSASSLCLCNVKESEGHSAQISVPFQFL